MFPIHHACSPCSRSRHLGPDVQGQGHFAHSSEPNRAVLGLPRARGLSSWCRSMPRGTCIGSSAWSKVACSGAGPSRRAIPWPVGQAPGRPGGGPPSRLRVLPGHHLRGGPRLAARGTEPAPRFACRATRIRSSECGASPHSLVSGFFARAFGTRRLDWVKGSRSACPRWVSALPRRPPEIYQSPLCEIPPRWLCARCGHW